MVIQFEDVVMVELVHDLHFELDLLHEVMLQDLLLIDDLNSKHVLTHLVPDFVHFPKPTNSDVRVGKGLKVVFLALPFFTVDDGGRQEENTVFDGVDFVLKLLRNFNRLDDSLSFFLSTHFELLL